MPQNSDKLSRVLLQEVREIALKVSRFQSPDELIKHFEDIRTLYEKSVFYKIQHQTMKDLKEELVHEQLPRTESLFDEDLQPAFDTTEAEGEPEEELESPAVPLPTQQQVEIPPIEKVALATIKKEAARPQEPTEQTTGNFLIKFDFEQQQTFIKQLFADDEKEFETVMRIVSQMDSKEEVLEFLSEVYHERKWKGVDRFAQEFWAEVKSQLR